MMLQSVREVLLSIDTKFNLLVPAGTLKYVKTGFVLSALKPVCRGPVRQVLLSLGRLTLGVH